MGNVNVTVTDSVDVSIVFSATARNFFFLAK